MKRRRNGLMTISVSAQTYHHLMEAAAIQGIRHPGQVVDKMMRNARIARQELRADANETRNLRRQSGE